MRKSISILLVAALALPIAASHASGDRAGRRRVRPDVKLLRQAPTFSDAGEFSGGLEGTIVISGTPYRLAPRVKIYEVGRGMLPPGTTVQGRMVAVSGVVLDGSRIVHQVIVRPVPGREASSHGPMIGVESGRSGPR